MFNLFGKSSRGRKVGNAKLLPVHEKSKDSQPDFFGHVTIKGKEYRMSAWYSETKNGNDCISISIQEKWKR